jgi:peptidoglycan/LPS O-acetylase OafA/YrhL
MISQKTRIKGLDSLRFLAFFSVFLSHATPFLPFGYYGIELFFVLSSFLLTYLALVEIQTTNKFSRKLFFIRRSLRLYPLYFAVLIGSFLFLPILGTVLKSPISLPEKKYLYFLFLSNFDNSDHIFALKFLWTISVEEQFYLLFILLSIFFKRQLYIPVIFLYSLYFIGNICGQIFNWNLYTLTTTYFPDFAVGMIAANLYFKNKLPGLKTLLFIIALSAIITILFHYFAFLKFFVQVPLSILISGAIIFTAKAFYFFSLDNIITRTTEYLGRYTYGLYVYSGFILTIVIKSMPWSNVWYKLSTESILLFTIAWLSYNYFEVFFINLKYSFQPLNKPKKQAH